MKPQLSVVPRDAATGDTVPGELFDPAWEPKLRARRRRVEDWDQYMAIASQVVGRFHGEFRIEHFDYEHPTRLQYNTPLRLKRTYTLGDLAHG